MKLPHKFANSQPVEVFKTKYYILNELLTSTDLIIVSALFKHFNRGLSELIDE